MGNNFTKATLETQYGEVVIKVNKINLTISDMYEEIIKPLLLGTGYSISTIEEYFEDK